MNSSHADSKEPFTQKGLIELSQRPDNAYYAAKSSFIGIGDIDTDNNPYTSHAKSATANFLGCANTLIEESPDLFCDWGLLGKAISLTSRLKVEDETQKEIEKITSSELFGQGNNAKDFWAMIAYMEEDTKLGKQAAAALEELEK